MATQCGITLYWAETFCSPLILSVTAAGETNLQLGKILPDRSIHQLYPQLMDDSLLWKKERKKEKFLRVALAQEKGGINAALLQLINVTIKTNHKLCVHYKASQGTT